MQGDPHSKASTLMWAGAGAVAAAGVWQAASAELSWLRITAIAGAGALAGVAVAHRLPRRQDVLRFAALWAAAGLGGWAVASWGAGILASAGRSTGDGGLLTWIAAGGLAGALGGSLSPLLTARPPRAARWLLLGAGWALVVAFGVWIATVAGYLLAALADEGPLGPDRIWLQAVGWALGGALAGVIDSLAGRTTALRQAWS